ncbi:hypothetical protein C8F01DRAFT_1098577 [Mycena amicta]|nr:hypothetical protein C8F01DRAFT_1098577 [Mycena amicta]
MYVSLQQYERVLAERQQATHPTSTSTAAVGHAAPLQVKIAQFDSKGGVPVPRGALNSFGIGAPPVVDRAEQQRRGELYGNRMKNIWVPSKTVERPTIVVGSRVDEVVSPATQLLSPPESPLDDTRGELPEVTPQEEVGQDDLDEEPASLHDEISEVDLKDDSLSLPSPPPSPLGSGSTSATRGAVYQGTSSETNVEDDIDVEPPRPSHSKTPSFSAVVYPRTRETPRMHRDKPTLAALLLDAAMLERRLLAGELPADAIRRLSIRPPLAPPPVSKDLGHDDVEMLVPVRRPQAFVDEDVQKETKSTRFHNPLSFRRKHKEDLDDSVWFPETTTRKWKILVGTSRTTS